MNALLTSLLALLIFLLIYIYHHATTRRATTIPLHRSYEPFTAIDVQLKNHFDLTALQRLHARYGSTFGLSPLLAKPLIYTVCPTNLKEIMTNGRDFGVEPLRGDSMGPFCGKGFLTNDGEAWMESRKMVKPGFAKKAIEGMGGLDEIVNGLLDKVKDGETMDLQPKLFAMVSVNT
jgi:cytochrome P450